MVSTFSQKGTNGNKAFALMNFPHREILEILFVIIFNPLKLSVKIFVITRIYFLPLELLEKTVNKAFSTNSAKAFFISFDASRHEEK